MGSVSPNRIPKVTITEGEEGGAELELSDDPYDCVRLNVENVPCIVTLSKVRHTPLPWGGLDIWPISLTSVNE